LDSLTIRRVALSDLHPDPANVRSHDERNLDAIAASLRQFGQAEPLVVQSGSGRVIGGNGRLTAMKALNWTECDVVELDLDDTQATALGIALNRTAELAEWDEGALAQILASLQTDEAFASLGFNEREVDELLRDAGLAMPSLVEDPGEQEPPTEPVTRRGDLWLLGGHRLLCGDSTSPEDVARLMAGETAVLLATDPPYLVDYQGGNHPQSWANKPDVKDKHWDDYVDPGSGVKFFTDYLRCALAHCTERVPVYQWHASRRQAMVEEAWKANGLLVHQTLIWVKARPVLTRSHFMWQYEPCFYGWIEGNCPDSERRPPPSERNVWEIDQVGQQDGIHPTQKPLEIFERPLRFHTNPGEVCLEPFSGSGTQLVAAERLGRRCFAMELSPAFVDAALLRWQTASGKTATLEGSGETFDALRSARRTA
jgi:DNA modification methylase